MLGGGGSKGRCVGSRPRVQALVLTAAMSLRLVRIWLQLLKLCVEEVGLRVVVGVVGVMRAGCHGGGWLPWRAALVHLPDWT